jgi:hypothetical protein
MDGQKYRATPKSVNLKRSLVLTQCSDYKPAIQFLDGVQRCEFCNEHKGSHFEQVFKFSK